MILRMIFTRLKGVFLFILNLIKKSLCCFRRRRKVSVDSVPLTGIGVISTFEPNPKVEELASWNSWDDPSSVECERPPQTVQEHIEYYRKQAFKQPSQEAEEPPIDFFQDMEPKIRHQKKMILVPKESTRLSFAPEPIAPLPKDGGELECWEEAEKKVSSWEEAESWEIDGLLKEKRKEDLKKKMMEKESKRTLVSKLS